MMNISIARIQAIFMKDFKEFSRNYAISVMVFVPIILTFLSRAEGGDGTQQLLFPLAFTFGMVTAFVQAALIAEEKERNTLRSLLLSPASLADILIGKSALVSAISAFTITVCCYVIDYIPSIALMVAMILSILFYTALGTICGLFAKSTLETTFTVLPVAFIFPFGPFVMLLAERFPFLKIAQWLPSTQLSDLAQGDIVAPLINIALWVVIAWVAAIILCKKRMVD
ncbi:ABC transporter permease [Metasolibacillus meyeri]|uniref:ABC transporter permease n=1 Tax=Metasolibacillus meyeri TaxID=1071052 RepID=UPI001EE74B17|nr:ABC transporter permease [Metasolibacillus meyeri]